MRERERERERKSSMESQSDKDGAKRKERQLSTHIGCHITWHNIDMLLVVGRS